MTNKTNPSKKPLAKRDLASPDNSLSDLKTKIMEIRLSIKAHQEKNTNAHKAIRKQIAQLLTTMSSSRTRGSI